MKMTSVIWSTTNGDASFNNTKITTDINSLKNGHELMRIPIFKAAPHNDPAFEHFEPSGYLTFRLQSLDCSQSSTYAISNIIIVLSADSVQRWWTPKKSVVTAMRQS